MLLDNELGFTLNFNFCFISTPAKSEFCNDWFTCTYKENVEKDWVPKFIVMAKLNDDPLTKLTETDGFEEF